MRHAPSFLLAFSRCIESYMFQGGGWTWTSPRKKFAPAVKTRKLEWKPPHEQGSLYVIQASGSLMLNRKVATWHLLPMHNSKILETREWLKIQA